MENLLLEFMEFMIEMLVVASFITTVSTLVSLGLIRISDPNASKPWVLGTPAVLSILVASTALTDHTSLREWAFFALPPLLTAPALVWSFHRKRLQKASQTSTPETSKN